MSELKTKILVVDDDATFRTRLVRALSNRGFETYEAADGDAAIAVAKTSRPTRAIVDLRMPGMSGLELIDALVKLDPDIQILVLTGYGSIATAVEAVRLGAIDYLSKPVDTEQILSVFERDTESLAAGINAPMTDTPPSLARVEYEHIQRVLSDAGGNISEAARRLGIHRRSLQRKLGKLPPLD
jgi:two-component system response regulator RegA